MTNQNTNTNGEKSRLPASLREALQDLITRGNVQSVSCPLHDTWLWRVLVEEQIRRAARTGLRLQSAFTLSGPDECLYDVPHEEWGGEVHIPFEGACGADLFIRPFWRNTFPEADKAGGSLSDVVFYPGEDAEYGYVCHYLLTTRDLGVLKCAERTAVGDGWFLYESNRPYIPNPTFKDDLAADDANGDRAL